MTLLLLITQQKMNMTTFSRIFMPLFEVCEDVPKQEGKLIFESSLVTTDNK